MNSIDAIITRASSKFVDTETEDCGEQQLKHCEGSEKFYRDLATQGKKVRVVHPQLHVELRQHRFEPARMPTRFHPHA